VSLHVVPWQRYTSFRCLIAWAYLLTRITRDNEFILTNYRYVPRNSTTTILTKSSQASFSFQRSAESIFKIHNETSMCPVLPKSRYLDLIIQSIYGLICWERCSIPSALYFSIQIYSLDILRPQHLISFPLWSTFWVLQSASPFLHCEL
jgi:hypothetical protein